MTPTDSPVPGPADLADHVAAMSDEPLVEGDQPLSIWMMVKSRDSEGDTLPDGAESATGDLDVPESLRPALTDV